MKLIEQLKSVLCGPDGKCCIAGSDEDRAIVDRALQALAQPVQPVGYVYWSKGHAEGAIDLQTLKPGTPLYTSPAAQPVQELVASPYNPNPVEYQYHYPDGLWRCSNGDAINGMRPDRARSLYALKDNT